MLFFEAARSFTGEQAAEVSLHGSLASISSLLRAARALGARSAEPGEFTERAFLNGRIDLTEAEAIRDTIEAETDAQLRLANLIRDGGLHNRLNRLREELIGILAAIEASVDFSEEVGEVDSSGIETRLQFVLREIDSLLETADSGRLIRQGLRIAIVGPPNAGKSSLLNAMLGADRSIVTEIPGTTRDYVEEKAEFNRFPVVLIDTAGLRDTQDPVESIGVQRARTLAANADLVWFVVDSREPVDPGSWGSDRPMIQIGNKIDLAAAPSGHVGISCTTREGLAKLRSETLTRFELPQGIAIQMRHEPELRLAREELELARETLAFDRPPDLAAMGIRAAVDALGRITGETADPDVISRIFRDFCIGK